MASGEGLLVGVGRLVVVEPEGRPVGHEIEPGPILVAVQVRIDRGGGPQPALVRVPHPHGIALPGNREEPAVAAVMEPVFVAPEEIPEPGRMQPASLAKVGRAGKGGGQAGGCRGRVLPGLEPDEEGCAHPVGACLKGYAHSAGYLDRGGEVVLDRYGISRRGPGDLRGGEVGHRPVVEDEVGLQR